MGWRWTPARLWCQLTGHRPHSIFYHYCTRCGRQLPIKPETADGPST